jgi:hypothetical protein
MDVSDDLLIPFIGVDFDVTLQLEQIEINRLSHPLAGGGGLVRWLGWVQQVLQVNEPLPLLAQLRDLIGKR